MEVSRPLFFGAVALSVLSAGSSAYLAFVRRAPATVAAPSAACGCDDAALRRELADLRRALDARGGPGADSASVKRLAARVAALESRSGVSATAEPDDDAAPSASATTSRRGRRMPDGQPAYTKFDMPKDIPSGALAVRQEEGGGLAVTNTDASLTGKILILTGHTEDGDTQPVTIVVPAPDR